ncbi:MAG: metal ABC transporter solute-binding protein, Zn/Mn family [Eubacteriaceae bacterium]
MRLYRKVLILIILLVNILLNIACGNEIEFHNSKDNDQITVAVSIVPEETFVKAVAGDNVNVVTMIPTGYSPENYQPSPSQITSLSQSKIYFSMGVPADGANIIPFLKDYGEDIKIIHLDQIVGDVYDDLYIDGEQQGDMTRDPHIWLSPKRVIVMIDIIMNELVAIDPKNEIIYKENAEKIIEDLEGLDSIIIEKIGQIENKSFLIYHPAYRYYADDYDLNMICIEEDGKEATAQRFENIIDVANRKSIKVIFYQEEFNDEQAKTIAKEIDGVTIKVSPLSEDYIENLINITNEIVKANK